MARGNWDIGETIRRSIELAHQGLAYRAEIEQRLEPGTLEQLAADSAQLREWHLAALEARVHKAACFATEQDLARRAAKLVARLRGALRVVHGSDKGLLALFAVGTKVRARSPFSVRKALSALLNAAEQCPNDRLRSAGILPEDLAAERQASVALREAELLKIEKVCLAKQATKDRDVVHRRVEATMTRVVAAARLVFCDRPAALALFESALPAARGKSRRGRMSVTAAAAPSAPAGPTPQP